MKRLMLIGMLITSFTFTPILHSSTETLKDSTTIQVPEPVKTAQMKDQNPVFCRKVTAEAFELIRKVPAGGCLTLMNGGISLYMVSI